MMKRVLILLTVFIYVFISDIYGQKPKSTECLTENIYSTDKTKTSDQIYFATKVLEYTPAPGQFINTVSLGSLDAALSILNTDKGCVSLGAFGGYIVLGFDKAIENNPDNPYGIDFIIFGNGFKGASEPGGVMVMKDENGNGIADDTWYQLAGSDYYFSSTLKNYACTYYNPGQAEMDIPWSDNAGNKGVVKTNSFHKQEYYPNVDMFPHINVKEQTYYGTLIAPRSDLANPALIVNNATRFGYADSNGRNFTPDGAYLPDNPYTKDILEGCGGDGMDISWAIDVDGNYIYLDKIDFVKIYTAVQLSARSIGEISTEVAGIVIVNPNASIKGETRSIVMNFLSYPVMEIGNTYEAEAMAFDKGILMKEQNIKWSTENSYVANVNDNGEIKAIGIGKTKIKAMLASDESIFDYQEITVINNTGLDYIDSDKNGFYPNPACFYIILKSDTKSVNIYSMDGKLVKDFRNINSGQKLDIDSLEDGLYIINYDGKTSKLYIKRD